MSKGQRKNMAASVKQRILNLARERNEDFNFLLSRYTLERFLFRLSQSKQSDDFVLKGAMLFHLRSAGIPHRATHDLDLLSRGSPDIERLKQVFGEMCDIESEDDGIEFDAQSVRAERIKAEDEYMGVRVLIKAHLGPAQVPFQIDVGFGDAVYPSPQVEQLATLLDLPAPHLKVYPWETVVAEKLHAIIELELDNSRMKDYFDLRHIASTMPFDGETLTRALRESFERRNTPLGNTVPIGLGPEFTSDPMKNIQWNAFLQKLRNEPSATSLDVVIEELLIFLMPPIKAVANETAFNLSWAPGGPWT